MYAENYKTLRTEKPPGDHRDTLFRAGRPLLLERLVLPTWDSGCSSVQVKVTAGLFVAMDKLFSNFYGKVAVLQVFPSLPHWRRGDCVTI